MPELRETLLSLSIGDLAGLHPALTEFIVSADGTGAKPERRLESWLIGLSEDRLADIGMSREQVLDHLEALARQVESWREAAGQTVRSLTVLGGRDKSGRPEALTLTLRAGDVVCIVGPTGSGKSRLLADIECLAQGDTPTGRRVLVNDAPPDSGLRFASSRKLIAQLSQNMNFVVDLSVEEFVAMHADCRMAGERGGGGGPGSGGFGRDAVVQDVIACANDLAGECFSGDVSLTQLSGGQTRALMIADTALLSASPVVLIDEIENAGIDRQRALDLLIAREKIVLISTHDPVLALLGSRRIVIRNGAVTGIIETGDDERAHLAALGEIDRTLTGLRDRLRSGQRVDAPLAWPPAPPLPVPQASIPLPSLRETEKPPMDALTLLLTRRSCSALKAPAPEGEALQRILQAALRVPDFQRLHPYHFILVAGEGLERLGALMQQAARNSGQPDKVIARAPRMPHRAPLIVIVVARYRPHDIVSRFEQQISAGCAAMAMQMAAVAQGFGGIWRTGWPSADRGLHAALGLGDDDQIVSFLYLGTPDRSPPGSLPEISVGDYCSWL